MAIERWWPRWGLTRGPLGEMERDMEEWFGRIGRKWPRLRWAGEWAEGTPPVDLLDRKDEVVLRADLPGLDQKDIDVTVEGGMLTIRGERQEEKEVKREDFYQSERWAGRFARSVMLPPGVDADKVKATFKNGVLEVHLPKTKEAKGKKVEVKGE